MHTCAYTCTPANTVVKNSNPVSYGKPNSTETLRLERKRCLVLCKIITQTRINRNDSVVKHTIDSIFFIFLDSIFYKDFIFQTSLTFIALFPGGSVVRNLHEVQEMRVWSLGWEDPLEEGMATHSSILAQRIPLTEEPGGLQSIGSQRVGHDWRNIPCTHIKYHKNLADWSSWLQHSTLKYYECTIKWIILTYAYVCKIIITLKVINAALPSKVFCGF